MSEGNGTPTPGELGRRVDKLEEWRLIVDERQNQTSKTQGIVSVMCIILGAASGAIAALLLRGHP